MTAVALLCLSERTAAWTLWPTITEAAEAATLFPECRNGCVGQHSLVYRESDGRIRVLGVPSTTTADTTDERQTA